MQDQSNSYTISAGIRFLQVSLLSKELCICPIVDHLLLFTFVYNH